MSDQGNTSEPICAVAPHGQWRSGWLRDTASLPHFCFPPFPDVGHWAPKPRGFVHCGSLLVVLPAHDQNRVTLSNPLPRCIGGRSEPWYTNAVSKAGPAWLTVNDGVTIITYAEPMYSTDALPSLMGVIAADFVLDKFIHAVVGFLKDVSPNGEVRDLHLLESHCRTPRHRE